MKAAESHPAGPEAVAAALAFLFDGFISGSIVAAFLGQGSTVREPSVVLA
jgi:hypothetical protein